jgi:uncharacterized protein (TIGR02246 family)
MTTTNPTAALSERDLGIRNVLYGIYTAWRANDADAFAAFYTADATAVLPGSYSRNRDEIRSHMSTGFTGRLKGSSVISEAKSIRFVGDGAAVVIDESGILMAGEETVPSSRLVRATWLLAKHGGQWLVEAYHNSPIGG